jgi:chromosome segregation ATPase
MKKLEGEKATLMNDLVNSQKELEKAKKELADVKKSAGDISLKLQQVDSQTKGMVQSKEQDLEGFRKRVVELERESKEKDERLIKLEARVVELSTEVADKDYEIVFYFNSIEEL